MTYIKLGHAYSRTQTRSWGYSKKRCQMHSHLNHQPRLRSEIGRRVMWAMPTNNYHHTSPPQLGSRNHPRHKTTQDMSVKMVTHYEGGHRPSWP